jgi:segregation and condensation protein A
MTSPGPEAPPPAATASYAVKLSVFEGPLDLLLHLIRLNEVDVTDIPIAEIASQYAETVELMQELNLDLAGEYLLMAATLAWIKSRMLLPPVPGDEDEAEPDPRAELVARLLEYQRFKEVAEALGERPLLGRDVFEAHGAGLEPTPDGEREVEVGLAELLLAFRRVLQTARAAAAVHEVEAESVTVRECMLRVIARLEGVASLEFEQLFAGPEGERPSRAVLVGTFLALLELVRVAVIRVYQGVDADGVPSGPIRLRPVPAEGGEASPSLRERIDEII